MAAASRRRRLDRSTILAGCALGVAIAAATWLVLWPCFYEGVTVTARPVPAGSARAAVTSGLAIRFCRSLVAENGTWVLNLLAVPIALSALGLSAAIARRQRILWLVAVVVLGLCLLAAWSIGLFFTPAAVALLASAATSRKRDRVS
jgi:hypothetical protein